MINPGMRHLRSFPRVIAATCAFASVVAAGSGHANPPNVRGRISGYEKLLPEVYAEAAKPDSHRWTWREPSPAVQSQFRTLHATLSRDVCIAATSSQGGGAPDKPTLMSLTGGRITPTTIVVAPKTTLVFRSSDPFPHRLFLKGNASFPAETQTGNGERKWTAPDGVGRFEFQDELFPSVSTVVLVDPQVVQIAYPSRDGSFAFALPAGDYVLKAFFAGKPVGKPVSAATKARGVLDIKEPLNVGEGL